jgi:hypothetical protein
MQPDLSTVTFNPNHRKESLGMQALAGLRLMLVSFVLYSMVIALAVMTGLAPQGALATSGLANGAIWLLSLVGFGFGAYGTFLVVDALGWAKYISFIIIASFLVPYLRMVSLLVVSVMAIDLVSKSGYRLTLFGKPAKVPARAG